MSEALRSLVDLPENAFILTSYADKRAFLKNAHSENRLITQRFISESDFFGKPADDFYLYMKTTFSIGPDHAKKILSTMDYVLQNPESTSPKLQFLRDLTTRAIQEHKYSLPNLDFFKNKPIFLINNPSLSAFPPSLDVRRRRTFFPSKEEAILLECPDKFSECHAVIERIGQLLLSGIAIDQIKIVNASENDYYRLSLEADSCGFELFDNKMIPLTRFPTISTLLRENETKDLETFFQNGLIKNSDLNDVDRKIFSEIVKIINQYGLGVLKKHPDLLVFELNQREISLPSKTNVVEVIDFSEVFPSPDLYFLVMNYNDESLPRSCKDTDYLSDEDKKTIGMPTSLEKNELIREETESLLDAIPHLFLFFSRKEEGKNHIKSDLRFSRPLFTQNYLVEARTESLSPKFDFLLYAKRKALYERFGVKKQDYALLNSTFKTKHHSFNPQFTGLNPVVMGSLWKQGVTLSPTSLSALYECRFKYFMEYLIHLGAHEESLELSLGNLTHYLLSKDFETEDSFEELSQNFIAQDKFLSLSETNIILTSLFLKRLKVVMRYLRERRNSSDFSVFSCEKVYRYFHPEDPNFTILGKIDLVMTFGKDAVDYVAVIDYKTGNHKFNEEDFEKRVDTQLVFYLHLLEKTGTFKNMKTAGFYYQPVNLGKLQRQEGVDPIKEKIKFEGRTLQDKTIAMAFDSKDNIRGIGYKNDGDFRKNVHLADEKKMQDYMNKMAVFINDGVQFIRNGDFKISPLSINPGRNVSQSCQYCSHQGICYMANTAPDADISIDAEGDE